MLIELNISEILLNVLPVYYIDLKDYFLKVLFNMGWDRCVCICLLWHIIVMARRVPSSSYRVLFVFCGQVKTEQQQQAWPKDWICWFFLCWLLTRVKWVITFIYLLRIIGLLTFIVNSTVQFSITEFWTASSGETNCIFIFGWNVKSVLTIFSLFFDVGHFTFKLFL